MMPSYVPDGMQPYEGDPPRRSRVRPMGQAHFRHTVDALRGVIARSGEERAMSGEAPDDPHVVTGETGE